MVKSAGGIGLRPRPGAGAASGLVLPATPRAAGRCDADARGRAQFLDRVPAAAVEQQAIRGGIESAGRRGPARTFGAEPDDGGAADITAAIALVPRASRIEPVPGELHAIDRQPSACRPYCAETGWRRHR